MFRIMILCCLLAGTARAQYQLVPAFPNLTFDFPVEVITAPDSADRLYVVEQSGTIVSFPNDDSVVAAASFLDLTARVATGGERGLLGLAFHPDYAENGYCYVNYTRQQSDTLQTVIARFTASAAAAGPQADPASEQIVLTIDQPLGNHNAGKVAFGPDGYLYVATGDGGGGGDPEENGQDSTTLLGSLLRLDVDNPDPTFGAYGIPPDNPFVGQEGFRPEAFAYGFRNVWKFAFDPATGDLWAADVGQNAREEVNVVTAGGNYGWNVTEGTQCFPPNAACDPVAFDGPIYDYPHAEGNRSVTGGYVYRGATLPGLQGQYVFGDFVSGRIWALDPSDTTVTLLGDNGERLSSFGQDADGELYTCRYVENGRLQRLTGVQTGLEAPRADFGLRATPNPARRTVALTFALPEAGRAELTLFTTAGRVVRTVARRLPAGPHTLLLDVRNLPPGVYTARLSTQSGAQAVRVAVTAR